MTTHNQEVLRNILEAIQREPEVVQKEIEQYEDQIKEVVKSGGLSAQLALALISAKLAVAVETK